VKEIGWPTLPPRQRAIINIKMDFIYLSKQDDTYY
jgi:hypothetical protein